MHEMSLLRDVVALAAAELDRAGIASGKVTRLTLTVGKMSCSSPEALHSAWELIAPNTPFPEATLLIHEPGPICRCKECGTMQEVDECTFRCPTCNSSKITIEGGDTLQLTSIDCEEEEKRPWKS